MPEYQENRAAMAEEQTPQYQFARGTTIRPTNKIAKMGALAQSADHLASGIEEGHHIVSQLYTILQRMFAPRPTAATTEGKIAGLHDQSPPALESRLMQSNERLSDLLNRLRNLRDDLDSAL